jgi:hypothetical protein
VNAHFRAAAAATQRSGQRGNCLQRTHGGPVVWQGAWNLA